MSNALLNKKGLGFIMILTSGLICSQNKSSVDCVGTWTNQTNKGECHRQKLSLNTQASTSYKFTQRLAEGLRDHNGARASGKFFLLLLLENSEEALKDHHPSNVPLPYHCMVLYLFVNLYLNTCDHVLVRPRVPGGFFICHFYGYGMMIASINSNICSLMIMEFRATLLLPAYPFTLMTGVHLFF